MLNKHYKSTIANLVILSIYFMLLVGCAFQHPELTGSIKAYFDSESVGDWDKVFSLRDSNFRQSVEKENFISEMKEASKGWELLKYKIVNIRIKNNMAEVTIYFLEKPPKRFWKAIGMQPNNLAQQATSIWVKEGANGWRCKVAPSRGHLPYSE